FLHDTAPTGTSTRSLHDALPICGRWWEIVAKYGVTILYTAPTAIRTYMKWGEEIPAQHDLSSLRLLGSVGEPINPEAWVWYRRRSEEHTSELQSRENLVCRLLLE